MNHTVRTLAVATTLVLSVGAAACSDEGDGGDAGATTVTVGTMPTTVRVDDGGPEPVDEEVAFAEFAAIEVPADAEVGQLLRYQPVPLSRPENGERYRILYRSETVTGEPTVVTGMVTVPPGDAPEGGWHLVSHAHGSTGLADDCAPSAAPDAGTAAEAMLVQNLGRAHDSVVVSTDYEGQGGPGRHPFLLGVSEGRSVLDAARAVSELPGVEVVDGEVGLVGYSQGGHAILWANQIAPTYAPELTITGTVSGAPASELVTMAEQTGTFGGAGLVMLFGGLSMGYPDADLDELLTAEGAEVLAALDESCVAQPDQAVLEADLLRIDPTTTEPWASMLTDNVAGGEPGAGPVLIVHGDADVQVPVGDSEVLVERMCEAGAVVERRVEPGAGHIDGAVPSYDQGFEWLDGLRAGDTPVDDCAL